jgi:16S rRNA (guanine966-N2)-methyltransferase
LFNIISPFVQNAEVLDLYAGTGSLGIEALSRGAQFAAFVDKSSECDQVIKENLSHTKLLAQALILGDDIKSALVKLSREGKKFDIVLLDPPYNNDLIGQTLDIMLDNDIIKDEGIVVAERDVDDKIPGEVGKLKLVRNQKYGDTILSFYKLI